MDDVEDPGARVDRPVDPPADEPVGEPGPEPGPNSDQVAFPGAEGWGAQTVGGRGGRVIHVTTLDWDYDDEGSFANALYVQTGPRTIVFDVSGQITVEGSSRPLGPEHSYVTIAGQTSPGGITFSSSEVGTVIFAYNAEASSFDDVFHDLIVRHVRFDSPGRAQDNIVLGPSYNVIFDHVDFAGAGDEAVDIGYSQNVTLQWSTIANSGPGSGYGMLLAYAPTTKISYHHNLTAHHEERCIGASHWGNELPNWPYTGVPADGADLEYRNNVVHNCTFPSNLGVYPDGGGPIRVNLVGNTATHGDDTSAAAGFIWSPEYGGDSSQVELYAADNHYADNPLVSPADGSDPTIVDAEHPGPPVAVTTTSAAEAADQVMERAGAWPRSDMTARIIDEIRTGTGTLGNREATPPTETIRPVSDDSDRDGMLDTWETTNGMTVGQDDSADDRDGDGWTNLEEYLHARSELLVGAG